jgi:hypothetical protein
LIAISPSLKTSGASRHALARMDEPGRGGDLRLGGALDDLFNDIAAELRSGLYELVASLAAVGCAPSQATRKPRVLGCAP